MRRARAWFPRNIRAGGFGGKGRVNLVRLLSASSSSKNLEATPVPTPAIRLREYQEECIQSVLSHLQDGQRRLGISLATGSGKTVIFTQLIDRVKMPRPDASQTLILVHRRELVEQAARHCINAYPSKTVEVEMGNQHASGYADITIASVLSLVSGDRLSKFDPSRFKLVLVDEAHHIVAASFKGVLDYFGLLNNIDREHSPALVGVSATFSRFDGLRLSDAIDHIVYHRDYVDMIGEKWLTDVIFTTVKSKADISKVKSAATGDFQTKDLSRAVNTAESNEIIVKAWERKASNRFSTLVFCVDLAHVASLTAHFREHGIAAQYITSNTAKRARTEILDSFKRRDFPVLLNCGIFTEGTDIPNIDCVILARPTKSRNLLVQMIGRGMRLYPGKDNCHVIDMVTSLEVGVVTTPTLFGLDPNAMVDEASVKEIKSQNKSSTDKAVSGNQQAGIYEVRSSPTGHSLTFTDYNSVYDLIEDTSSEKHIRSISTLSWVAVDRDRFILTDSSGSYVTIEKHDEDTYFVTYTGKLPMVGKGSPFMRPRDIAKSTTFEDAVHAADTFAMEKFPFKFINHSQPWRRMPATEGQLAFLNKTRPTDSQLTADMVNKGKAGDMITKFKFGARGRFQKLTDDNRRARRAVEKSRQTDAMRRREVVRVGPTLANEDLV